MLTKEVLIPLLRSLITGLLAGELLFALGALFAWDNPGRWQRSGVYLYYPFLCGGYPYGNPGESLGEI